MYIPLAAALLLAGSILASPAVAAPKTPLPAAVPTGPAVSCVLLQNIRSTNVVDSQTIDFKMNGGQTLRNTLPASCPQLGFERAFTYQTSIGQLCSVDIITVIVQGGGLRRGASCGLGKFVPIATPARK